IECFAFFQQSTLLRTAVLGFAYEYVRSCGGMTFKERFGDAEIDDLHAFLILVRNDHQVVRRNIPMDDALFIRRFHAHRRLLDEFHSCGAFVSSEPLDPVQYAFAADQLHYNERHIIIERPKFKQLHEIWMFQTAEDTGFAQESFYERGLGGKAAMNDFDRSFF